MKIKYCPRCGHTTLDQIVDTDDLRCNSCSFTEDKNNFPEAEEDKVQEEFENNKIEGEEI